jgi:hypothetical protein
VPLGAAALDLACDVLHDRGMASIRHPLTRLCAPLVMLAGVACEDTHADYALCDGSEQIRFGFKSGGGQVEQSYFFLHRFGFRFLFIDGRCDFLFSEQQDAPGAVVRGHLDASSVAQIEARLRLDQLPEEPFVDMESCPDAGNNWLATAEFYGNCTCDCAPPAALEHTLSAIPDVLATLRTRAAAASGAVELVALMREPESPQKDVPDWPFAWPVTEVVNDSLSETNAALKLRVLEGSDADTARALRSDASTQRDKRVLVRSDTTLYELFARDQIEDALLAEIQRFSEASSR